MAAPRWRVYREIMKLVDNAFSPFALTTPCSTPTRDRGTRDDMRRRTLAALLTLLFLGIGCPAPAARCGRACCLRACRPAVDRCVALSTLSRHTCRRTLLRECKSGGPPACDGAYPPAPIPPPVATSRLEYVFPDGSFSVYDMDNGHQLVKSVALPQARGIRGVIAHAATHALYISYGGDGDGQHGAPNHAEVRLADGHRRVDACVPHRYRQHLDQPGREPALPADRGTGERRHLVLNLALHAQEFAIRRPIRCFGGSDLSRAPCGPSRSTGGRPWPTSRSPDCGASRSVT